MYFIRNIKVDYRKRIKQSINFVLNNQLKDKNLWKKFVNVFRNKEDVCDNGWRCEFFGKMMRGACLVYLYTKDSELYEILENAVKDLLTTQDEIGRFTSYIDEFQGWDMWGRKYVLTSLIYFFKISNNKKLKDEIILALKKHADYIVTKIGPNDGQKDILDTSDFWGGLNSASIAETFIDLFRLTNDEKYLNFAKYVLSTGGCKDGDLIKLAFEGKLAPFNFPVTKAYEMMSFFEGCLEYYKVSGDEYYFKAFSNFIRKVKETDVTAIGCCGCTHELFDNSFLKQTEESNVHMQETCVTVTWIRILEKYYELTHELWCLDEIEKSTLNALYGSINKKHNKSYSLEDKKFVEALPFDSYSPLYMSRRGLAIGGYKTLGDGSHYGCCACIASAGIAIYPLLGVISTEKEIIINYPCDVSIKEEGLDIAIKGCYFKDEKISIKINKNLSNKLIKIRIPCYFKNVNFTCGNLNNGYLELNNINKCYISYNLELKIIELNNKILFTYGPLVLGQDNKINKEISLVSNEPKIKRIKNRKNEIVRFFIDNINFINYSSLCEDWDVKSMLTIWNDKRD